MCLYLLYSGLLGRCSAVAGSDGVVTLKEHGYAPDSGDTDDDINYTGQRRAYAENARNKVEVKDTDKQPVKTADYCKNQCQLIHIYIPRF
jgi:hypothetical protein